ncbi:MAG TPA: family 43 glycosylhydrolase [Candidatus Methylacidiphilales bacterium]
MSDFQKRALPPQCSLGAHGLSRRQFLQLTGVTIVGGFLPSVFAQTTNALAPVLPSAIQVGKFTRIYDPSVSEDKKWYINDHTFIRADDGQWHLFGITHPEPANGLDEKFFAHATAPDLMGPWTKQASVLQADPAAGEAVVWAPYVFKYEDKYWIYYCGGGASHDKYRIQLATSSDLFIWERSPANPMLIDGWDARDPMVLKVADDWVLYYCATSTPQGGNHTVKSVKSKDLLRWTDPTEVFSTPKVGRSGGPTESPFVVARNGKYYLFVCTNIGYVQTAVYVSDSAFHWDFANQVGVFPAHAAEVIQTSEGKWWVSRAGWGQGGVSIAELTWIS